jgi:hypothetical protein
MPHYRQRDGIEWRQAHKSIHKPLVQGVCGSEKYKNKQQKDKKLNDSSSGFHGLAPIFI